MIKKFNFKFITYISIIFCLFSCKKASLTCSLTQIENESLIALDFNNNNVTQFGETYSCPEGSILKEQIEKDEQYSNFLTINYFNFNLNKIHLMNWSYYKSNKNDIYQFQALYYDFDFDKAYCSPDASCPGGKHICFYSKKVDNIDTSKLIYSSLKENNYIYIQAEYLDNPVFLVRYSTINNVECELLDFISKNIGYYPFTTNN